MGIPYEIKALTAVVTVVGGAIALLFGIGNKVLNTNEYLSKDFHSVERPTGFIGSTELTVSYSEYGSRETVEQTIFSGKIDATDSDLDGKVDSLEIRKGSSTKELSRDKHYTLYKADFDAADKLLAQTKVRFQKYFPEMKMPAERVEVEKR